MLKLIVLVGLTATVATAASDQFLKMVADRLLPQCAAEKNMDYESLRDFVVTGHLEPTRDNKCLVECLFKKLGVMDDNGTVLKDVFLESVKKKEPERLPLFEKCLNHEDATTGDSCEVAYAIEMCIDDGE